MTSVNPLISQELLMDSLLSDLGIVQKITINETEKIFLNYIIYDFLDFVYIFLNAITSKQKWKLYSTKLFPVPPCGILKVFTYLSINFDFLNRFIVITEWWLHLFEEHQL